MEIRKVLNKYNIKVIAKVKKEEQIIIADNVATMLSDKFNYIKYAYVYNKLMESKMYIAQIPKEINRAVYMYEEDALYIDENEDINNISEGLLYECIHVIQNIRDDKGNVKQLGQCSFSEFKVYAMALNEASIQYIVSKVFEKEEKTIQAYGVNAKTYSENKYPLICNILMQLMFITDETENVESTIYANDNFVIDCIENLGGEISFINVQNNLDSMLYASEEIIELKRKAKTEEDDSVNKTLDEINEKEETIARLYMDCQMTIFTVYFDKLFTRIETLMDVKYYKSKLEEYKELLGYYENEKQEYFTQYYDEYCVKKEEKLNLREEEIKRKDAYALIVVSDNPVVQIFNKIKNVIFKILK